MAAHVPTSIPPFQLQFLVSNLCGSSQDSLISTGRAPLLSRVSAGSPPPPERSQSNDPSAVRCAQGLGKDIYVGCGDGTLLRCNLQDESSSSGDLYHVVSRQTIPTRKPIDEIALVPSISKALVLSANTLHFYTLPNFEPVPTALIQPIRSVLTFALDELTLRKEYPPDTPERSIEAVGLCVIRKRGILLFALRERLYSATKDAKPIPLTTTPLVARRIGKNLCLADSSLYSLVDLEINQLTPVIPVSQVSPPDETPSGEPGSSADTVQPFISIVTDNEFLVLSWTGSNTLGLFINANGDPTRGTLEWPYHPISLSIDYPYVTTLLPNHTTEIHNIETLSISQIISHASSPSSFEPRSIECNSFGCYVPLGQRNEKFKIIPFKLSPSAPAPPQAEETHSGEPTGSGLTPPPTPLAKRHPSSRPLSSSPPLSSSFARSKTLLLGPNSLYSLLPSTLLSQIEALLEDGLLSEAVELAEGKRKKSGNGNGNDEQSIELRYVYQLLAHHYLNQTLFAEAGDNFFRGETDPRLLLRLFPDLYSENVGDSGNVGVFKGLEGMWKGIENIDEIIRNYSPHIKPSVESASSTSELKKILGEKAREMLTRYLWKMRNHRMYSRDVVKDAKLDSVIDTTLVKLYAETSQTSELHPLIESSSNITLNPDLEKSLISARQYQALAKLYEKAGNEGKVLEILIKIAEGTWREKGFENTFPRIVKLLEECKDRNLVQQYGLWVVRKDAGAGFKLFTSKRQVKIDDLAVLREFRKVDAKVADEFLEHVVLVKRSTNGTMHNLLAMRYLDTLLAALRTPSVAESFSSAVTFYIPPHTTTSSFLTYFALTSPTTDTELKRTRLKLIFFLQGSNLYDIPPVQRKLDREEAKWLSFERAIIEGKLGNHRTALNILVSLGDSISASAYCTLGGEIIPLKTAQSLAEQFGLGGWVELMRRGKVDEEKLLVGDEEEKKKKELLRILMEVYMSGGDAMSSQTAELLNSQAVNLDVADVLSHVPPTWSLSLISSFLTRSLRRGLHDKHEGEILKSVSWGQNIEVSQRAWNASREEGAVVEEPIEDENEDGNGNGGEKDGRGRGEPSSYAEEKVPVLGDSAEKGDSVTEIR